ncbi:hypothetical protein FOCC_FOCC002690 [Frankliniella occidentalis]|nr:hypothetical protein FOCC_FOCC002690 [Frankliniella occidentalis]
MFASVRRCRSRDTGTQLAAKFSSRQRYGVDCSAEIHHEIALLSLCSPSPRVVKLHDVFQTDTEIILVMEYAPGGDLQTLIDDNIVPYESDVVSFTRQLVEGLGYLHHRKIAHLDIKPQNLVMMGDFPDCDVKLCDFEISRVILEGTEIREILGTPDYVAPEILHYEPITMAADMWSLGVTVYVLLTGFSPFGGETDQETFCNISRAQLDFPEELSRPTAKECLRHPWLSQRSAESGPGRTRSCASCSQPATPGATAPNLRKYLSKSREALFERVLQRGGGGGGGGPLGAARTKAGPGARLCESQMSLVSKSRERELQAALVAMSPSLSRSREKLYGLRSLSRSQEVLAMYRALPGLRTLTRATTADLSQLGLLGRGSHTSVGSELDTLPDLEDEAEPVSGSFSTPATPAPSVSSPAQPPLLERTTSSPTPTTNALPVTVIPTTTVAVAVAPSPAPGDRPTSPTPEPAVTPAPSAPVAPVVQDAHTQAEADAEAEAIISALRSGLLARGAPALPALLAPLMVAAATSANGCLGHQHETRPEITATAGLQREQSTLSSHSESSESTLDEDAQVDEDLDEDNEDNDSDAEQQQQPHQQGQQDAQDLQDQQDKQDPRDPQDPQGEQDIDEPRFTVQQLITAYNLHDEVVTKSSLDFTMAATDRETKILQPNNKSKFPTGPNALRLFIPDIDITNAKPRKSKSGRKPCAISKIIEEDAVDGEQPCLSPETISNNNNNVNSHVNNNNNNVNSKTTCHLDMPKPVIRVDDVSYLPNGTDTPSALKEPPPPPPLPPTSSSTVSLLEPKKSFKSVRPGAPSVAPASSVHRHRRSASTPNSEPRTAGLSPSPSPSTTKTGRSSSNTNGVHRSGSAAGPVRKTSGSTGSNSTSEKLRRKSTPVFK